MEGTLTPLTLCEVPLARGRGPKAGILRRRAPRRPRPKMWTRNLGRVQHGFWCFLCCGDGMFRSLVWVSYPGNPCDKGFLLWDIPRRVRHELQPSTLTTNWALFTPVLPSQSHLGSRQVECAQRSAEREVNERFWWLNFKLTDSGGFFLQLQSPKSCCCAARLSGCRVCGSTGSNSRAANCTSTAISIDKVGRISTFESFTCPMFRRCRSAQAHQGSGGCFCRSEQR